MKRRAFVQLSAWGTLSIPLGLNNALPNFSAEHWQSWLQDVVRNCAIKKVGNWSPEKLQIEEHSNVLLQRKDFEGFTVDQQIGSFTYEQEQQQYVFAVLTKRHPVAGLLEVSLPFWVKRENNHWEYITTFSQFQLEAVAHFCRAEAVQDLPITLQNACLPVLRNNSASQRAEFIPTQAGWMEIKTVLSNANILTTIAIYQNEQRIWQEDFVSKHRLNGQITV